MAHLIRLNTAGPCMDCVTTETNYACATCRRYFCTGCARSDSGCPNCNARWADLEIRGKLGTHATAVYYVQDADTPPSVGDCVMVRSEQDKRVSKWTEVIVDEIRNGDFFFMAMR